MPTLLFDSKNILIFAEPTATGDSIRLSSDYFSYMTQPQSRYLARLGHFYQKAQVSWI